LAQGSRAPPRFTEKGTARQQPVKGRVPAMFSNIGQQQVIGAAAQDPRLQQAAKAAAVEAASDPRVQQAAKAAAVEAAGDPRNQSAAWNAARNAARGAVGQGAEQARAGLLEVRAYIQESHCSVRIWCFCVALALLVSSALGVFNVFNALFKPYQYLWAIYNVIFAGVIIIIDGKPEWFARCGDLQTRLFRSAAFLASWSGRALLYFYVGSINLFMLPSTFLWKLVYIAIGTALCCVSALMLLHHCGLCHKQQGPYAPEP